MIFSINPETNEVKIDFDDRAAYCLACGVYLGRVFFPKHDGITEQCLTKLKPLCRACLTKLVPKQAEIIP